GIWAGASIPSRTRSPLVSRTVIIMSLPITTFSPGFLLRTSMFLLHASRGWVGAIFQRDLCPVDTRTAGSGGGGSGRGESADHPLEPSQELPERVRVRRLVQVQVDTGLGRAPPVVVVTEAGDGDHQGFFEGRLGGTDGAPVREAWR